MISKSIVVIEHDDLYIGDPICHDEPNLVIFRYNNVNEKFMSHEKMHNIQMQAFKDVFRLFNLLIFLS